MSRKRYTPEQIIGVLREAEVLLSQGRRTGEVCCRLGILEQSYYSLLTPCDLKSSLALRCCAIMSSGISR